MFEKILIANRGEIAVRIMRTCRRLGIRSVAVYSNPDFRSLHVLEADEAFALGGTTSLESYLSKEKIIEAAVETGVQAIHPGYGFLAENAEFAEMVVAAGLVFIGPPAKVIATLGDKIAAKRLAAETGLPVLADHAEPVGTVEEAGCAAERLGYPVMLKPAAGGGGKGMRIVTHAGELAPAFSAARQEAGKAFGDDRIFIERYLAKPRHIEFQIMADRFGNVIHLGERECSIQRRYQKLIEESPSVAIDDSLRSRIGAAACELARRAGYENAGTVEFLLDERGEWYFLEVNTRLQVEHPVTEMVTSLDLVELQIRVASGEPLPLGQGDVVFSGAAIEARICAEDPHRGFIPSVGIVTRYAAPRGAHVRVDSGIGPGSTVSIHYDSLLAKVISWGATREEARRRLVEALNGYHIEGVVTNVDYLNGLLMHPAFVRGDLTTRFIADHVEDPLARVPPPTDFVHFMVIAATLVYHNRENLVRHSLEPMAPRVGREKPPAHAHAYVVRSDEQVFRVVLEKEQAENDWGVRVDGRSYQVTTPVFEFYRRRLKLQIDGVFHMFRLRHEGNFIGAAFCGITKAFEIYTPREWELARYMPARERPERNDRLLCPMPGLVLEIMVTPGQRVYRGQEVIVLESMKMQTAVASPCDGIVHSILVGPGATVETGDVIMTFLL
jgi:propionyl-CoA carboxylase alpha chain